MYTFGVENPWAYKAKWLKVEHSVSIPQDRYTCFVLQREHRKTASARHLSVVALNEHSVIKMNDINNFKLSGNYTYHLLWHSVILHSAHSVPFFILKINSGHDPRQR
jgi:hypothetical protein